MRSSKSNEAREKVAKVINRAKSGGVGGDIAQRHFEALAKKREVSAMIAEQLPIFLVTSQNKYRGQLCGKCVW
jgi:hypothetical protein